MSIEIGDAFRNHFRERQGNIHEATRCGFKIINSNIVLGEVFELFRAIKVGAKFLRTFP